MGFKADQTLTQENWNKAYRILSGADRKHVSWASAARAAGVSIGTLRQWIARSAQQRVEDEPWVHRIATDAAGFEENQAGAMEDRLWGIAMKGRTEKTDKGDGQITTKTVDDVKAVERALEVRDRRYKKDGKEMVINLGTNELFTRFKALALTNRAKDLKDKGVIELQKQETEGIEDPTWV